MLRPKLRTLMAEAIEAAASYAAQRALKHTDRPSAEQIAAEVEAAVWLELDQRFHIDDEDEQP